MSCRINSFVLLLSSKGGHFSDANVASPKHSTPHVKSTTKGKFATMGRGDAEEGRRKSKRKSKRLLSPVLVTADSTTSKFFSDGENEIASAAGKRQKTPRKHSKHCSSTEDISFKSPHCASTAETALSSLSKESTNILIKEDRCIKSGCLIGNDKDQVCDKSLNHKPEGKAIRKSIRKSTRISMMKEKDCHVASNLNTFPTSSEDEDLSSSVSSLTLSKQIPFSKKHIESSDHRARRSTRKSTVRTPRVKESQTDSEEGNFQLLARSGSEAFNNDCTSQTPGGKRSASHQTSNLSNKKKATDSSESEKINSSILLRSLQGNNINETEENIVSKLSNSSKQPQRRSMRMLTYNEPEMTESNDSGISPRKRPCLTPVCMTKSMLSKCESGIVSQEPSPMAVDKDITPLSDQRGKMQSALAERKSASPFLLTGAKNDFGRVISRSAGKSNLCDRMSTARGRRTRRSMASNLQMDEQTIAGQFSWERFYSRVVV